MGERLRPSQWLGLAMLAAGVVVLALPFGGVSLARVGLAFILLVAGVAIAACDVACLTALAAGTLTADGETLVLADASGEPHVVNWPGSGRCSARRRPSTGPRRLLRERRRARGRLHRDGRWHGTDDVFHGCGPINVGHHVT